MAPGPPSRGAAVIRAELKNIVGAAALSIGIAWCGASALSAAAQSSPAQSSLAKSAPAESAAAKSTAAKSAPAKSSAAKPKTSKSAASKSAASKSAASKSAPAKSATIEPLDEVDPGEQVSDAVIDIAGWVIASGDNRGLPFAVVDKDAAQVLVFDADGKLQGLAPVLVGSAVGDDSAPGVGDRELRDIPLKERTTPAGRYLAGYGPAKGGERVLWVDYATSVSIHALPKTSKKKEKRKERLASPTPDDNRITHGCINVSPAFYSKVVRPTFKKGGVFYVLPDSTPLQAAFPAFEPRDRIASSR